jgi:hypothetical protein
MLDMAGTEHELADECLRLLRALPFVKSVKLRPRLGEVDAEVELVTTNGDENVLPCEIKRAHLGHDVGLHIVNLSRQQPGLILFAPAIGRDLGDVFEQNRVNFIDSAGNCFLRIGDNFVARVQGRTHEKTPVNERALRAPGYRALLSLLVRPGLLDAASRTIAAAADVAPQTANDVRRRLVADGLVLETRAGFRWTPGRRKDAVAMWIAGFGTTLSPTLAIGRFRSQDRTSADLEARFEPILDAACEWRYGGGAAANRFTHHYRGDRTILYTHGAPADLWSKLRLVRDASGPILLARAPGPASFDGPDPRCVHPLLVYADLLAEGHERAREAAAQVRDTYFDNFERAA